MMFSNFGKIGLAVAEIWASASRLGGGGDSISKWMAGPSLPNPHPVLRNQNKITNWIFGRVLLINSFTIN